MSSVNTFAKQPQTQRKALKKALQSPFIGKHGKRKSTLLKEEVYKEMQNKILEKVDVLIDAQISLALTGNNGGPDGRAIEMLLNRAFGKPGQDLLVKFSKEESIVPDAETEAKVNEALDRFMKQRVS